jgi:hypothetical protein
VAPLGDRSHAAYPAVDPDGPDSRLYVRDTRLGAPQLVPRRLWRFADPTSVALDGGFEPGRLYEVVYRSRDPRVVGCGLAATRDLVSFFKHEASAANPLPGTTLAYAHGISQSGRFLRHFLYQGFNADEQGRRVFDGVIAEVAGAGTHPANPNDFRPALRALVRALDEWVARGVEPPRLGAVYTALVPAVDADGNDRAGIRLPEIAVPLATQTGWNPRHPRTGAATALASVVGSYLPFARTKAEREAAGDPRPSIEERYADRAAYLGRVAEAALVLTRERLLLPQDVPRVLERAAAHWELRVGERR